MARGDAIVTIGNPGWHKKRTLVVAELAVSWEVSKLGILSGKAPWKTVNRLIAAMGRSDLKGAWIAWYSPQLGYWGGIVRRNPSDISDGLVEISADSFHILFKGVPTRRTYLTSTGSAGQLAVNVITDTATDRQFWIDDLKADSTGPVMSIEWRGDDLYDVLDGLAQDSGYEWDVALQADWTIDFEFRKRVGSNKLGRVLYAEGYNVLREGTVSPSLDDMTNEIRAVPGDQIWEHATGAYAADADSVRTYGRQAFTRRYVNLSGPSSLETRARSELRTSAQPVTPIAITVPIGERQLPNVRIGDSVRYWSARQNKRFEFRIFAISYDAKDGTVKLSGDGYDMDADAWAA